MPQKSLAHQLREIANANTVEAARKGFAVIDHHAARAKAELKKIGIEGCDDVVDKASLFLKRKAAELMTGRPQ